VSTRPEAPAPPPREWQTWATVSFSRISSRPSATPLRPAKGPRRNNYRFSHPTCSTSSAPSISPRSRRRRIEKSAVSCLRAPRTSQDRSRRKLALRPSLSQAPGIIRWRVLLSIRRGLWRKLCHCFDRNPNEPVGDREYGRIRSSAAHSTAIRCLGAAGSAYRFKESECVAEQRPTSWLDVPRPR
jgi:hypothetical protein